MPSYKPRKGSSKLGQRRQDARRKVRLSTADRAGLTFLIAKLKDDPKWLDAQGGDIENYQSGDIENYQGGDVGDDGDGGDAGDGGDGGDGGGGRANLGSVIRAIFDKNRRLARLVSREVSVKRLIQLRKGLVGKIKT